MRVHLDECLPRRLKHELLGHYVQTVPEAGWSGKENGELLRLASIRFDVFVTIDRNLQYQQNLEAAEIGLVVVVSRSNRYEDLLPLVPQLRESLDGQIAPGVAVRVGA